MRYLLLWIVLFAVYASTLGIDASGTSDYSGDEPHHLLAAESLVTDGDVDLTDEYATRAYAGFHPTELERQGRPTRGRIHEPHAVGFPVLIAPAYAAGGARGVELFLAAVAALAFAIALALARMVVPEPWATRGVALVGLSVPAVAYGATVYPELAAGALLATAVLFAVRAREDARVPPVAAAAAALALLPWLGTEYLITAVPVAGLLVHWTLRQHRRLPALIAVELLSSSLIAFTTVSEALYGGMTPHAAEVGGAPGSDAGFPERYLGRVPRLAALWIDRDHGLLRWAPVLALAFLGAWLLWRSWRDRIARALPGRREAETVAGLALAVCASQALVAVFAASTMVGDWFPGRHLVAALPAAAVLVAWGLRRAPRLGAGLGALTLVATGLLWVQLRTGTIDGWAAGADSTAPWGPLERLLPTYMVDSVWAETIALILLAALMVLVASEWRAMRSRRHTAASTKHERRS